MYSIQKALSQKDNIRELEKKLDEIDLNISKSTTDEENNKLQELRCHNKELLDNYYSEKAVGAQIRSKANWTEEGERSTSYFLNLEQKHQSHNHIKSIRYQNSESCDNQGILDICATFYRNLYSSNNIPDNEIDAYMSKLDTPGKLTEKEKDECEGKIRMSECNVVIKKLKKTNHLV